MTARGNLADENVNINVTIGVKIITGQIKFHIKFSGHAVFIAHVRVKTFNCNTKIMDYYIYLVGCIEHVRLKVWFVTKLEWLLN